MDQTEEGCLLHILWVLWNLNIFFLHPREEHFLISNYSVSVNSDIFLSSSPTLNSVIFLLSLMSTLHEFLFFSFPLCFSHPPSFQDLPFRMSFTTQWPFLWVTKVIELVCELLKYFPLLLIYLWWMQRNFFTIKTLYPSIQCRCLQYSGENTEKYCKNWCSVISQKDAYLLVLSKEKLCLRENGFIILRVFSV